MVHVTWSIIGHVTACIAILIFLSAVFCLILALLYLSATTYTKMKMENTYGDGEDNRLDSMGTSRDLNPDNNVEDNHNKST